MSKTRYSTERLSRYLKGGYVIETENDQFLILVKRRKVGVFWNLLLTVLTGGLWLVVWGLRLIFRNSIVKMYKGEEPIQKQSWLTNVVVGSFLHVKALTSRGKLLLAAFAAGIIVIAFTAGIVAQTNEENLAKASNYATHQSVLETKVPQAVCSAVEKIFDRGSTVTFAKNNQARAKKAAMSLTKWNADSYVAKSNWVLPASAMILEFEIEQENLTNKLLEDRVKTLKVREAEFGLNQQDGSWGDRFRIFVVENCNLEEKASTAKEKISDVSSAALLIQAKANSKPWYPKGFEETGFPGFAFQNISNQGCSYSFGSCARFKIVSKTSCPSNLYVRTNHLVNGEVDDWSNDTATVAAGQVAIMETAFSSNYSGTWQFVEIKCY